MTPGNVRGLDPSQTEVVRLLIQRANTLTQLSLTGATLEILAREESTQNLKEREVSPIKGRHMSTLIRGDTHVDSDSSRILWDGEFHPVKWHPNCSRKAFCLVSTSSKAFPYMDKAVAHDTLLNNLKVTPSPGENPGLGRKGGLGSVPTYPVPLAQNRHFSTTSHVSVL